MYNDVLTFWFEEIEESHWWVKDSEFDEQIKQRFSEVHTKATKCELFEWRSSIDGRLAEIIVLDQFSRNIYRDTPQAFANDALALSLAQEAISLKLDQQLEDRKKSFLYIPFMHSESQKIHEIAVELYSNNKLKNLDFEIRHKKIIDRFGRYPHRNDILGRTSTAEEIEFLKSPGSRF